MKPIHFARGTPAKEMLARRRAWRVDPAHYEVIARDGGHRYEVALESDGELSCSCTAGHYGRPCWHEQKVARRLLREGVPDSLVADGPIADELTSGLADDDVWGRLQG